MTEYEKAVEALAKSNFDFQGGRDGSMSLWTRTDEELREAYREEARAAMIHLKPYLKRSVTND